MFVDVPKRPNGVCTVSDMRTETDLLLARQGADGQPVYRKNATMRDTFQKYHANTTRVALFEYGSKPTAKQRAAAKHALVRFLETQRFKSVCVFPTPSDFLEDNQAAKGTNSWPSLAAPDSLDAMRGTWWDRDGTKIVAMYPCLPIIDETFKVMNRQWAQWCCSEHPAYAPSKVLTHVTTSMADGCFQHIRAEHTQPIAVDIETIDSQGLITAIGIANRDVAISIPWDRWQPAKADLPMEPGLDDYPMGKCIRRGLRELLADPQVTKVGQNFLYDLPRLERAGLPVAGPTEDTLAAHAIVYPTLPHGLQKACASMFPVPPWKSLFKTPEYGREDERSWRYEPAALRNYNALDAYYTLKLWRCLNDVLA